MDDLYLRPYVSPAEEMPKLTPEQERKLAEICGKNYDPVRQDNDTHANEIRNQPAAEFAFLIECMDRMAEDRVNTIAKETDVDENDESFDARYEDMLRCIRADFMKDCSGLCRPGGAPSELGDFQKMQENIYLTLRQYDFGATNAIEHLLTFKGDEERQTIEREYHEQWRQDELRGHERPADIAGRAYESIVKAGRRPILLAKLCVLPLDRILSDAKEKLDRPNACHRELANKDHEKAVHVYEMFKLLGFDVSQETPLEESQTLLSLRPPEQPFFPDTSNDHVEIPWKVAYSRFASDRIIDNPYVNIPSYFEHCYLPASFLDRHNLLTVARSYRGFLGTLANGEELYNDALKIEENVRTCVWKLTGTKQGKKGLPELVTAALEYLGLKAETETRQWTVPNSGGKRPYLTLAIKLCDLDEQERRLFSLDAKVRWVQLIRSLAESVAIALPTELCHGEGRETVRACQYLMKVRMLSNDIQRLWRQQALSCDQPNHVQRALLQRTLDYHATPPFDEYNRVEQVDGGNLRRLLNDFSRDEQRRVREIERLYETMGKMDPARDMDQFDETCRRHGIHSRAMAQLKILRQLNAICDPTDNYTGLRRHTVPYEKKPLGRAYTHGQLVNVGVVPTFDDEDVADEKQRVRSVSYQGMYSELRPLLGPFLRDVDMVKAFATICKNLAQKLGVADKVPMIIDYADRGADWLQRIVDHHHLGDAMDEDDAKAAAKELVNSTLNFGGYRAWKRKHARTSDPDFDDVVTMAQEVGGLRGAIFDSSKYRAEVRNERNALKLELHDLDDYKIERKLWARFLQQREHEVLMLIDRKLRRKFGDASVMALVFDGLLLKTDCSSEELRTCLDEVEAWLEEEHEWTIKLLEKPNYGLPFASPKTLLASRALLPADDEQGGEEDAAMEEDDPASQHDPDCYECSQGGYLLECESCPRSFHPHCAGYVWPPEGDFVCPVCDGPPEEEELPVVRVEEDFECCICFDTSRGYNRVAPTSCSHPNAKMCVSLLP